MIKLELTKKEFVSILISLETTIDDYPNSVLISEKQELFDKLRDIYFRV